MRTKDTLFDFDKIPILLQYLYMDESHKVIIHNAIDVPLELYMVEDSADKSIHIMCRNLNFPDIKPMLYDSDCHPETLLRIISQLTKEPAAEYPDRFKNRWEEIETITRANLSLNIEAHRG